MTGGFDLKPKIKGSLARFNIIGSNENIFIAPDVSGKPKLNIFSLFT